MGSNKIRHDHITLNRTEWLIFTEIDSFSSTVWHKLKPLHFFFLISSGELANGDDTDKGRPSNRW